MSSKSTPDAYSEAVRGGILGEKIFKLLVKVTRKVGNELDIEVAVEKEE